MVVQMFLSCTNHIQDQYIFIHDAILESLICGDTELDAGNFRASLHILVLKDLSGRTEMDRQFAVSTFQYILFHKLLNFAILQILDQVCPIPRGVQHVASKRNTANNVSEEFLPGNRQLTLIVLFQGSIYLRSIIIDVCNAFRKHNFVKYLSLFYHEKKVMQNFSNH